MYLSGTCMSWGTGLSAETSPKVPKVCIHGLDRIGPCMYGLIRDYTVREWKLST